jgi:hypothetical protein
VLAALQPATSPTAISMSSRKANLIGATDLLLTDKVTEDTKYSKLKKQGKQLRVTPGECFSSV